MIGSRAGDLERFRQRHGRRVELRAEGVAVVADRTLQFRAIDFFEIQRAIRFIVM